MNFWELSHSLQLGPWQVAISTAYGNMIYAPYCISIVT
jgi:hypothetical protein